MQPIYLPTHVEIVAEQESQATFVIHPYHPGYGPTLANALRRVLLSSLPGAAITHVRVDGVDHEFSTLPGVKEDMMTIILNLKQVRLATTSDQPIEIVLEGMGERKLTAGDFTTPPEVTVSNPRQPIATLTSSQARLVLRCTVEQGRGYVPSEARLRETRDIGTMAIDAIFTPVVRVNFTVENVRVGQATDYHKLRLTIITDGTVKPIDALKQAASILRDHFSELANDFAGRLTAARPAEVAKPTVLLEPVEPENTLSQLQLPSRVHNALERVGITTVDQVLELTSEQIQDIPGLGQKAVEDITAAKEGYRAAKLPPVTKGDEAQA